MSEQLAITLSHAARMLSLKDRRTMLKYGREGRIRIVGSGTGQRVVVESIYEYLAGTSEWHEKQNQQSQSDESLAPARSASSKRASFRGKRRSRLDMDDTDTTTFNRARKLQRI
jgi:hypothetical protein